MSKEQAAAESIVLEEEIDENYEPTEEEIVEYAKWLGMDLEEDSDLRWIAREGLKAPLPEHWKPCKTQDGEIYYFNFATGDSVWDHPCDEYYRNLYQEEKKKKEKQAAVEHQQTKKKKEKKEKKEKATALPGVLAPAEENGVRNTGLVPLGQEKATLNKKAPLAKAKGLFTSSSKSKERERDSSPAKDIPNTLNKKPLKDIVTKRSGGHDSDSDSPPIRVKKGKSRNSDMDEVQDFDDTAREKRERAEAEERADSRRREWERKQEEEERRHKEAYDRDMKDRLRQYERDQEREERDEMDRIDRQMRERLDRERKKLDDQLAEERQRMEDKHEDKVSKEERRLKEELEDKLDEIRRNNEARLKREVDQLEKDHEKAKDERIQKWQQEEKQEQYDYSKMLQQKRTEWQREDDEKDRQERERLRKEQREKLDELKKELDAEVEKYSQSEKAKRIADLTGQLKEEEKAIFEKEKSERREKLMKELEQEEKDMVEREKEERKRKIQQDLEREEEALRSQEKEKRVEKIRAELQAKDKEIYDEEWAKKKAALEATLKAEEAKERKRQWEERLLRLREELEEEERQLRTNEKATRIDHLKSELDAEERKIIEREKTERLEKVRKELEKEEGDIRVKEMDARLLRLRSEMDEEEKKLRENERAQRIAKIRAELAGEEDRLREEELKSMRNRLRESLASGEGAAALMEGGRANMDAEILELMEKERAERIKRMQQELDDELYEMRQKERNQRLDGVWKELEKETAEQSSLFKSKKGDLEKRREELQSLEGTLNKQKAELKAEVERVDAEKKRLDEEGRTARAECLAKRRREEEDFEKELEDMRRRHKKELDSVRAEMAGELSKERMMTLERKQSDSYASQQKELDDYERRRKDLKTSLDHELEQFEASEAARMEREKRAVVDRYTELMKQALDLETKGVQEIEEKRKRIAEEEMKLEADMARLAEQRRRRDREQVELDVGKRSSHDELLHNLKERHEQDELRRLEADERKVEIELLRKKKLLEEQELEALSRAERGSGPRGRGPAYNALVEERMRLGALIRENQDSLEEMMRKAVRTETDQLKLRSIQTLLPDLQARMDRVMDDMAALNDLAKMEQERHSAPTPPPFAAGRSSGARGSREAWGLVGDDDTLLLESELDKIVRLQARARRYRPSPKVRASAAMRKEDYKIRSAKRFIHEQKSALRRRQQELELSREEWKRDMFMLAKQPNLPDFATRRKVLQRVKASLEVQARQLNDEAKQLQATQRWVHQREERINTAQHHPARAVFDDADSLSQLSVDDTDLDLGRGEKNLADILTQVRNSFGGFPARNKADEYNKMDAAARASGGENVPAGATDLKSKWVRHLGPSASTGNFSGAVRSDLMEFQKQMLKWSADRDQTKNVLRQHADWLRSFPSTLPGGTSGGNPLSARDVNVDVAASVAAAGAGQEMIQVDGTKDFDIYIKPRH